MAYFLRKFKHKKGDYYQICETKYDMKTRSSTNKSYKILGYIDEAKKKGVKDPLSSWKKEVDKLNSDLKDNKKLKVTDKNYVTKNIGYYLLSAELNKLDVDKELDLMGKGRKFQYKISDFLRTMIYCRAVDPGSKLRDSESVIPSLFNRDLLSENQILDGVNFLGTNYQKYIELFNHHIKDVYGDRPTDKIYFDCTNYYFEIDLEKDDKQKGVSKENRTSPIIGQALMLDSNQIPIAMEMYPGNASEKPYLRKNIEDMKARYNINGKVIQVADKGLNCAKNIYSAVIEANDGYIFSKSIKNLSEEDKYWITGDNSQIQWKEVYHKDGTLKYKYKEIIETYEYKFDREPDEDGEVETVTFSVKEKRILTYNPSLATKKKAEISKEVEKALKVNSFKQAEKSEYGDSIKYVKFDIKDQSGKKVKIKPELNLDKIEEDKKIAGYNLLVTSEIKMSVDEIYKTYHNLWKIEETFRCLKTLLDSRPVYVQKKETIYGHFLICYLTVLLIRLLEIKEFNKEINASNLIKYIRDFKVTCTGNTYLSNICKSETLDKISKKMGLSKLDNLYLSASDLKAFTLSEI